MKKAIRQITNKKNQSRRTKKSLKRKIKNTTNDGCS